MQYKNTPIALCRLASKYQVPLFLLGWLGISLATLTPLEQLPVHVPGSDKLHHVVGFFGWTIMIAAGKQSRFIMLCCFIFLWGGAIEIIQPYINRYGEWLDFAANSLGIALAYGLNFFIRHRLMFLR